MYFRFCLEISHKMPACGTKDPDFPPNWWYTAVYNLHYLHFGILLWAFTGLVTIIVSLATDPIPENRQYRYLYSNIVFVELEGQVSLNICMLHDQADILVSSFQDCTCGVGHRIQHL